MLLPAPEGQLSTIVFPLWFAAAAGTLRNYEVAQTMGGSLMLERELKAVAARNNRYRLFRSRRAVLGPGALTDAGPLWGAGLSAGGTSVRVLLTLARLHWYRYKASRGDDVFNDYQAALVLFTRVGQSHPHLVPAVLRPALSRGVTVDHQFIGPEHWGRIGIGLLREAEATGDPIALDLAVDVFEGTVAAYSPDHEFWPGDMANLRYALRMRYGLRCDPRDRSRSIIVNRALHRGRSPNEPLGADVPPVPPLPPKVNGRDARHLLEPQVRRISELHNARQFEVAEDEARDLLVVTENLCGPDDPLTIQVITLLASILTELGESDDAERARREALTRSQRSRHRR